jgi:hypothetical protein
LRIGDFIISCWADRNHFHAPVGKTVKDTVNAIHFGRGLIYGEIERNGVSMYPDEVITSDGDFHFVNFQSISCEFLFFPCNIK